MKIRKRLILLFLLLTVVPFVVLQINTQAFYVPTITNRVTALFTYNLQQKRENLRRLLAERVSVISQIAYDQGLAEVAAEVNQTPDPTSYQRFRMQDFFSRFTLNSDLMAGMGYLRPDGLVVGYERFGLGLTVTDFSRYGSVQEVMARVAASGSLVTFPTRSFSLGQGKYRTVILCVFPYYELNSNRRQGFYYLLLNEAAFQNVLNPSIDDGSGILARSVIYDAQGNLVSFPDPAVFAGNSPTVGVDPQNPGRAAAALAEFHGKSVGAITLDIPKTNWTVGTLYSEQSLFSDRNNMIWYTLLVGLVFFLSALIILWLGSRDLLRSFGALVEQVRVVGNRLDFGTKGPGDELEFLGDAFRRMQEQINGLVTEVNDRNASLLTLAEEQRLAEIRALEAQVNPHFLYNTLNTLNWIAIRHRQTQLSQGLSDLADIMRYSISQIEVTARLEDELAWLHKYLDLQKLRFQQNFAYTVDNRGVRLDFRLYKLLLQPLVENALVHGFDPNVPGGLLEIRLEMDEGRLVATVSDNGRGLGQVPAKGRGSIGLSNLERRLAVYYPGQGSLTLESRPGGGTTATLTVPEAA